MQGTVIIDTGSYNCKAGFSDDVKPRAVVQSLTAHPSTQTSELMPDLKDVRYVGAEAFSKRAIFKLRYPVENGLVKDWNSVSLLWNHIHNTELHSSPTSRRVLYTDATDNTTKNRIQMIKTQFEEFGVPALLLVDSSLLGLYATGRSSGIVLDIGHESTTCVAISSGAVLPGSFRRTSKGGKFLTEYFVKKMSEGGKAQWTSTAEIVRAGEIKEEVCYVAVDLKEEISKDGASTRKVVKDTYGEDVEVGEERFLVGEGLFEDGGEEEGSSLDRLVFDTILKAEENLRPSLLQNIILTGGTSHLPGLASRLKHSLQALLPEAQGKLVTVVESDEPQFSAWIGGSKIASSEEFKDRWVTKEEYRELGAEGSLRKMGIAV